MIATDVSSLHDVSQLFGIIFRWPSDGKDGSCAYGHSDVLSHFIDWIHGGFQQLAACLLVNGVVVAAVVVLLLLCLFIV